MPGDFGTLLRQYRLSAGLTQEGLAEQSGVSTHAISVLESGRRRPRLSSATRLAMALGLDPADRDRLLAAVRGQQEPQPGMEPVERVVPRLLPYAVPERSGPCSVERVAHPGTGQGR